MTSSLPSEPFYTIHLVDVFLLLYPLHIFVIKYLEFIVSRMMYQKKHGHNNYFSKTLPVYVLLCLGFQSTHIIYTI